MWTWIKKIFSIKENRIILKGYQPEKGFLNNEPPKGGSGISIPSYSFGIDYAYGKDKSVIKISSPINPDMNYIILDNLTQEDIDSKKEESQKLWHVPIEFLKEEYKTCATMNMKIKEEDFLKKFKREYYCVPIKDELKEDLENRNENR